MKVVEFYIMRRTLAFFAATMFWVLAIVWTTQILSRIDLVTTNGQSAGTFFEVAWLILPAVIPIVIPFAVAIAVAQTLSTMNTDSELVVISAAGSPKMTVVRPILLIAIAACIASFVISNFVEPHARMRLRTLISEARAELITTVIQDGTFQKIDEGLHLQIGERLPDGRFGGIFVSDTRDPNLELLYHAKSGATLELEGIHLLVLQDGVVHRKTAAGDVSIVRYQSYALDLSEFSTASDGPVMLAKDRTLGYLMNPDKTDEAWLEDPQRFRAELHKRFTDWLYPLVFALIGLAVAGDARSFRETRIHPLLTAMTIAVVIRWAGFLAVNKVENSAAFTVSVYAVPLLTMALCVYFISSSRMLELPAPVTERAASIADRIVEKTAALRLRLSGYKRPTARSSA